MAIIKTTPTFNLLTLRFLSTLSSAALLATLNFSSSVYTEYFPRPTLLGASRTLFTSLLAEAIDDDGMCLDKGPPGLGSTEPEPFFK